MKRVFYGVVALSYLATASNASAWIAQVCDGQVMGIRSHRTLEVNRCSIPAGSARDTDLIYADGYWDGLQGIADRFNLVNGTNSCSSLALGDGTDEIGFVDPAEIDGDSGLAVLDLEGCVWPYTDGIDGGVNEFDVMISNTLPLGPVPDDTKTLGARETLIHELGHVLGADHENGTGHNISVMCASNSCGKAGMRDVTGATFTMTGAATLFPDDVEFMHEFHNTTGGGTDLAASGHWSWSGGGHEQTHLLQTLTRCAGENVGIRVSHANLADNDILSTNAFASRIVFSTNNVISTSDTTAFTVNVWANRGEFFTNLWTLPTPNLPPATYFVGYIVDPSNTKAEFREANNAVLINLRVKIVTAGCPI